MLVIENVLSRHEVGAIRDVAKGLAFGDGKATAGRHAREVKANDQALASPELDAILGKVEAALAANPIFRSAARPKALTRLILSRYRQGSPIKLGEGILFTTYATLRSQDRGERSAESSRSSIGWVVISTA